MTLSHSGTTPADRRLPAFRPLYLLRATASALTTLRFLPIFTPRATLARWRSQRAIRVAARDARKSRGDPAREREWQRTFRMNGLCWHHLYIAQDLRRIRSFLREKQDVSATPPLVPLEKSFSYLVNNVWDVYNFLEKDVLFPWIAKGVDGDPAVLRALQLFSVERSRIEEAAAAIQARFSRLVCSTGHPYTSLGPCSATRRMSAKRILREKRRKNGRNERARANALSGTENVESSVEKREKSYFALTECFSPAEEAIVEHKAVRRPSREDIRQLTVDLSSIIDDTERLHRTERELLFPLIANTFSEREQGRLTQVLVYSMRSSLAKFIITIYHQAVDKQASRAQWKWYKREVPLPIRVYTPVWRARLFDDCPLGWLRQTPLRDVGR